MSELKLFNHKEKYLLESGEHLPGFQLAYQTFGKLNEAKDNVVWIIHALTANSNPAEWWPGVVGNDEVINPKEHFIICANCLGSHYGSTSSLNLNPNTGLPYYHDFPIITNRDIVSAFDLLRVHLGIDYIQLLTGASLGGQQALEWSIINNEIIKNLCLLATNAFHSPWGIAFNESQRMAIENDPTWNDKSPHAGINGMKTARSIALLSYRTKYGYDTTQEDPEHKLDDYRVSSYQRYQGEKLAKRFNAFSYWYLSKAMDNHNVGRGRGTAEKALNRINANTTIIGIHSDILFPIEEQEFLHRFISNSTLVKIKSLLGHDGFLTESKKVSEIFAGILTEKVAT